MLVLMSVAETALEFGTSWVLGFRFGSSVGAKYFALVLMGVGASVNSDFSHTGSSVSCDVGVEPFSG